MPLSDEQKNLRRFANLQGGEASPVETFLMEPLPPKVLKAFPELEAWHKRENDRRVEFIKRLNTTKASEAV